MSKLSMCLNKFVKMFFFLIVNAVKYYMLHNQKNDKSLNTKERAKSSNDSNQRRGLTLSEKKVKSSSGFRFPQKRS